MQNAHLRMGRLTFARRTRHTFTNVSVYLECLIAETPKNPGSTTSIHVVSAFGGDQDMGAMIAAVQEGLRFQIEIGSREFTGTLGDKPTVYRASLQVPGRKRPVRHAVMLSRALFETTLGSNREANRTVLFDDSQDFVLYRLASRFGLPVLPEWANWFAAELKRRGLFEQLCGLNCSPVAVKATKLRLLRILSQGLRRTAIGIREFGLGDQNLDLRKFGHHD